MANTGGAFIRNLTIKIHSLKKKGGGGGGGVFERGV